MKAEFKINLWDDGYYASIKLRHNLLEDGELLLSTKDVKTKATAKRHAIKVLSDLGITDYEEIK